MDVDMIQVNKNLSICYNEYQIRTSVSSPFDVFTFCLPSLAARWLPSMHGHAVRSGTQYMNNTQKPVVNDKFNVIFVANGGSLQPWVTRML